MSATFIRATGWIFIGAAVLAILVALIVGADPLGRRLVFAALVLGAPGAFIVFGVDPGPVMVKKGTP